MPVDVGEAEFERLVADALDSIPEALGRQMQNVAVTVADWPTAEQLAAGGEPCSACTRVWI